MEGTFDIRIDTPKTFKRGTVALKGASGQVTATVNAGRLDDVVVEGTYQDKEFAFDVDIEVPEIGQVNGSFTGTVWGNSIDAVGQTNIGKVEISGTSISTSTGDSKGRPGSMDAGRWSDGF